MLCESGLTRPDSTCLSGGSDHSDVMLQSNLSARATQTNLAFWTCAAVTCISALVSAGFSVVGLSGPSGGDVFERYATHAVLHYLLPFWLALDFVPVWRLPH
jgi:hypothetical protein